MTDHFQVNRGLTQGDGLAPLLLNTALEYARRQLSVDVYSSLMYKSGEIVGYADDINIMGRSTQTVGKLHRELEEHKTVGCTINTTKTNVTIQSRRDLNCKQMEIQDIAAADCFTYLRTINRK